MADEERVATAPWVPDDRERDAWGDELAIPIEEDAVQVEIRTYDASDVERELNKPMLVERAVGKAMIALRAYNPLPLLRLALVEAHAPPPVGQGGNVKRGSLLRDILRMQDPLWDLGLSRQAQDDTSDRAKDLVVASHSPDIQRAFRASALQALMLYVFAITVVATTALLLVPWEDIQGVVAHAPYLLVVLKCSLGIVTALSAWLVYALRFEGLMGYVAYAFLTLTEICNAIAWGISGNPQVDVQGLMLLLCGLVLLRAFACRVDSSAPCDDSTPCLAVAAIQAASVLAAVAIPLNFVIGEDDTHLSMPVLFEILGVVEIVLLWVALVLSALTQTMQPVEHAAALIFFQADLIVLFVVFPGRAIIKELRQSVRCMKRLVACIRGEDSDAEGDDYPSSTHIKPRPFHPNVVRPAFCPDAQLDKPATSAATSPGLAVTTVSRRLR